MQKVSSTNLVFMLKRTDLAITHRQIRLAWSAFCLIYSHVVLYRSIPWEGDCDECLINVQYIVLYINVQLKSRVTSCICRSVVWGCERRTWRPGTACVRPRCAAARCARRRPHARPARPASAAAPRTCVTATHTGHYQLVLHTIIDTYFEYYL